MTDANGDTYTQILDNAVSTVNRLKANAEAGDKTPSPAEEEEPEDSGLTWLWVVIGVIGGFAVIAAIALVLINRKKSANKAEAEENSAKEEKSEEEKSE